MPYPFSVTTSSSESSLALQKAAEELKQQSDSIAAELRSSMETLAATLASRVLRVDVTRETAAKTG